MEKENIVMIVADQMRCDAMHHMGNKASITPNLDMLAQEGVSFANAYCQNPVCVPSRCSFLSGLYPHTTGHRTMHYLQRPQEHNIFKEMKKQGYEVIWIGRNDLLMPGLKKDEYCDAFYNGVDDMIHMEDKEKYIYQKADYTTPSLMKDSSAYSFYHGILDEKQVRQTFDWKCFQTALDYLDKKAKEKDGKPFFLYISVLYPHPPYECEEPWFSSIDRALLPKRRRDVEYLDKPSMLKEIREKQELKNWNEKQFSELRGCYLAMVSRFDYQIGTVVNKLKEKELYDHSNIFVLSDHGDYTGDYGIVEKVQNCFEDPITNVPLLFKPSKRHDITPGISNALVELLDIPATFADIGDFSLTYTQFRESLLPIAKKEKQGKKIVLCEGGRIHGEQQAMEAGHGKESPYWPRLSTQEEEGAQHTKAIMARSGHMKYVYRLYEDDELYDLKLDPYELHNLIHEAAYQAQVSELRYQLLGRLFETTDVVPMEEDKRINW